MHVIESAEITRAAALAIQGGSVVLILRRGLLTKTDFTLLRSILGCVAGTVDPTVAAAAQTH